MKSQLEIREETKRQQMRPTIGFMISEIESSTNKQKNPHQISGVIISDGSLLNNPHINANNNMIPPHETSACDFDAEKKHTAFFPIETHGNEDPELKY